MKLRKLKKSITVISVLIAFSAFSFNALAQPIPTTTDSRIRTLVYNPNEVYELKFYYGYQSFIEFADSEEIEMISIGEAFAWRITPSGKRLFIRPLEIAAHTNMTLITNKRTYHFDIRSDEYSGKADEELVYTVRFYYPQINQAIPIPPALATPLPIPKRPSVRTPTPMGRADERADKQNILEITSNPEGLDLNFDYNVAGRADNLVPLKVYDNGRETYMQFKDENAVVPVISAVDAFGVEHQLEYIIRDNYVIVPTIERQFTLRLASGLICLYNNVLLGQ